MVFIKKKAPQKPSPKETPKKTRRRKKKRESFNKYIHILHKYVDPSTKLSKMSMVIMNNFMMDIFERVASEASRLMSYNKKSTFGSHEVQTAVRLILPGELAKLAISEGTKAVTRYNASRRK